MSKNLVLLFMLSGNCLLELFAEKTFFSVSLGEENAQYLMLSPLLLVPGKKCSAELFISVLIYSFSFSFYNSTPFLVPSC